MTLKIASFLLWPITLLDRWRRKRIKQNVWGIFWVKPTPSLYMLLFYQYSAMGQALSWCLRWLYSISEHLGPVPSLGFWCCLPVRPSCWSPILGGSSNGSGGWVVVTHVVDLDWVPGFWLWYDSLLILMGIWRELADESSLCLFLTLSVCMVLQ